MATTSVDGMTGIWLPLLFYYVRDWRILFYINLGIVSVVLVVYFIVIPESPRFYLSRKDYKKARKAYSKIALYNGREMFDDPLKG